MSVSFEEHLFNHKLGNPDFHIVQSIQERTK